MVNIKNCKNRNLVWNLLFFLFDRMIIHEHNNTKIRFLLMQITKKGIKIIRKNVFLDKTCFLIVFIKISHKN